MKKFEKNYLVAGIVTILAVCGVYIFPFMLANNVPGNDISWMQWAIAGIFLLPAVALFVKKPKSLWVYIYPVLLVITTILAFSGEDALGAGLLIMFVAVPVAVVYSILVFVKVIK